MARKLAGSSVTSGPLEEEDKSIYSKHMKTLPLPSLNETYLSSAEPAFATRTYKKT